MRRGSRKIPKILRLIIFLGLPVCLFLLWRLEPLLIKNIEVTTDYDIKSNPQLLKILEGVKGQNLLSLDSDKLAQTIIKQDIKIKDAEVQKKIPGTLLIYIQKRQALAVIPFQGDFFLVDKDGLILSQEKETPNLPVVTLNLGLQNLKVGSSIDSKEKSIFHILDSLKGKEKVVSLLVGEDLELQLEGGTLVFLPRNDESQAEINSLQILMTRFRIEGRLPLKIDLRFDKPVVTF